jgi:predicted small secreted protein
MSLLPLKTRGRLLAILALASCLIAGCNAAAEQAAYRKVKEAGGRLSSSGKGPEVEFSNLELTNEELASLKALPHLHELRIINVPLTDSAVDILLSIERIDDLRLVKTKISEAGIQRLKAKYPDLRLN